MHTHHTFFITVRGIIMKDGKLFCQKLKHSNGVNDFWATPGGHLDHGESFEAGLTREMLEETGVPPQIGRLLFTQQYMDDDKPNVELFYHILNADDYTELDLANTSHGLLEVDEYGFVDPKTSVVRPTFLTEIDLEQALAGGSVQNFNYL